MLDAPTKLFPGHAKLGGVKVTQNVPGTAVIIWFGSVVDVVCLSVGLVINNGVSHLRFYARDLLNYVLWLLAGLLICRVITVGVKVRFLFSGAIVLPVHRIHILSDSTYRNGSAAFSANATFAAPCSSRQLAP
jgi:hypothetical protein